MKRRLFTLAAALSLLLCAALLALAVASYFGPPATIYSTGLAGRPPQILVPFPIPSDADEFLAIHNGRLEQWEYTSWDRRWYLYSDGIGLWLPILLAAALPCYWLFSRMRRRQAGCCPVCGYDLRGTPDRCPECGTEVKAKASAITP
jgi:hypothetical protein